MVLRRFCHYKSSFWSPERFGGGDLSIESRLFWRNICHFGANLTFKSDFESYFTFKKPHLRVQKWMGGEVLRSESRMFVDQLENSLESRKCQKGGGINLSGLVQNLSEVN